MADEMQASVGIEWVTTDEKPFRPGKTTEIFAVLEPLEVEQATFQTPTWTNFYDSFVLPPAISYTPMPDFEARETDLIINIETTAVLPWESRIIMIGVLNPNALAPETMNFYGETEEETLQEFLDFFENSPYTRLVGYNVSFDKRFIYTVCQKYRKEAKKFRAMPLQDLMQIQKQVEEEFVFGFNKPGTLEQWSTYLFGTAPYAPQKQVWAWFKEGNWDEVANFNSNKLAKAYGLYVLNKVVEGTIPGAGILGRPAQPTEETAIGAAPESSEVAENLVQVECPICHDMQDMSKSAKVIKCRVCGTPIANPNL